METTGSYSVLGYCPQCKEQRGLQLKRIAVAEELERDAEVRVLSPICGHTWSLTAEEKENLRKFLAENKRDQLSVATLVAAASPESQRVIRECREALDLPANDGEFSRSLVLQSFARKLDLLPDELDQLLARGQSTELL